MKTNTDPNGNKNNITFRKYEKYGNTYIRARQWVTLIDGTVERLEGSGKNRQMPELLWKRIFMKDMEAYRKELSNARYDKRTTKKKHEPEYAYYSASTLNRIIRLVVAAVDE